MTDLEIRTDMKIRNESDAEMRSPSGLPKQPVIAVVGPTGTGKTKMAIQLANLLNGEIISGDSMQVYRQMNIGTAKATRQEQQQAIHHLIDIQDYSEPYNVAIFQDKCRQAIEEISSRGRLPIICGGTGLYIKAALYDYEFRQEREDPKLKARFEEMDNEDLVRFLKTNDEKALEKIHPNNRKRLIRAAMMAFSDQKKTDRENAQKHKPVYDVFFLGLNADKTLVDSRIERRVDQMFEEGLAQEASSLFSQPKSWEFTSFQGIGYKEFRDYFEHRKSLDEVRDAIVIHSRQYAKRQMTWFRNQMPVRWYDLQNPQQALNDAKKWAAARGYGSDRNSGGIQE